MAVVTTLCPYPVHKLAQTFSDRLTLDGPVSTTCFGPIVGKSEKVERPRAWSRCLSTRRPLELNQRRLFGMNGEVEAIKALGQDRHHPAGIGFQLETDNEIIGKTN